LPTPPTINITTINIGDSVSGLPGATYDTRRGGSGGASPEDIDYEVRVTGKTEANRNLAVFVSGTEFDWYDETKGALLDAKNWENGGVHDIADGTRDFIIPSILDQANRQINAVQAIESDANIVWIVAGGNVVNALQRLFRNENIGIEVRHSP
jgi:hypothetical protein